MKLVVASGFFAVGLIVLAGSIVYTSSRPDGHAGCAEALAAAERIGELEDAVATLTRALEERSQAVAAAVPVGRSSSSAEAMELAAGDEVEGAAADGSSAEAAGAVEALLAKGTPEEKSQLREFMYEAIRQERKERQNTSRRRMEERQREMAAMREGPYGKHNYKVNSLGKKLDMNDGQKQGLYDSLLWYEQEKTALKESISKEAPEGKKEYAEGKQVLVRQFNESVAGSLDVEQAEVWNDLPEWEKNPSNRGGFAFTTAFGGDMLEAVASPANVSVVVGGGELYEAPAAVGISISTEESPAGESDGER